MLYFQKTTNLGNVGFGVEVTEEDDERDHVNDEGVLHPEREVAAVLDAVYPEDEGAGELYQLEDGQVLLPPEELGDLGTQGRQSVVRVHEHVDEAVDHRRQEGCRSKRGGGGVEERGRLSILVRRRIKRAEEEEEEEVFAKERKRLTRTARHPLDADPPEREHGRVVVDVEEAQLVVLLAEDEEEGVAELEQLAEVVPPNGVRDLQLLRPGYVPDGLAHVAVPQLGRRDEQLSKANV